MITYRRTPLAIVNLARLGTPQPALKRPATVWVRA